MQTIDQKHSSTYQCAGDGEDKKKYAKLTSQIKQLFIQKIVFENLSIKKASELLNINYSSAKAIASCHKKIKLGKNKKNCNKKPTRACEYREINENEQLAVVGQVCSSIGGLIVSEILLPKRKFTMEFQAVFEGSIMPTMEAVI